MFSKDSNDKCLRCRREETSQVFNAIQAGGSVWVGTVNQIAEQNQYIVQVPLQTTITNLDDSELKATLQAMYKQNYSKLPRLFSKKEVAAISDTFVNVSILKEEAIKEKEKELSTSQTKTQEDNRLHSHERLYEEHEPIPLEKLFAPLSSTKPSKKLLLYGRAGIGKTVLCQYIANQWAEERLNDFKQFKAVFWIRLRELVEELKNKSIHREIILAEMVAACCLKDNEWLEKIKKKQLEVWLKAHAEQTLFILDGYDEIAETVCSDDLSFCLYTLLNHTQYKPYVLMTSRPVTIASQYDSFDRHLECMGFTDANITVFVQRFLSNPQQSNACLTFLKSHPSIWGTAHIPINLELICWWRFKDGLSINKQCLTMTALYNEIVEKISLENTKKYPLLTECCYYQVYDKQSCTIIVKFANDFLPFLGFCAMQQSGILLSGKEIRVWLTRFINQKSALDKNNIEFDAEDLLRACLNLGFLKSTQEGGTHFFDYSYYFIHLSFQEFFAAKYYQQAFEREDKEVIQLFITHKYTPSYQLTWWMNAGLLYLHKKKSELTLFFQLLCKKPLDVIGIQHFNLLSHCLDECQADEAVEIIAGLVQRQANFFAHCLRETWLTKAWGSSLLHCPNLLHAEPFQKIGVSFIGELKNIQSISNIAATLLSHVVAQRDIACLVDKAIHGRVRGGFAKALSERSDLTTSQVQTLIVCLADASIGETSGKDIAKALSQRLDLTEKQVEVLIAYLKNTTIHAWAREELVEAFSRRSSLTADQIQALIACLADVSIQIRTRKYLAKALTERSDLPAKQELALITCLADKTIHKDVRESLASALNQRITLTSAQVQAFIYYLADTTIDESIQGKFASALGSHPNLAADQIQALIACLADVSIQIGTRKYLAKSLAERLDLPAKQELALITCLADKTIHKDVRESLASALNQRITLTSAQVQAFIYYLADTTIDESIRGKFASALGSHSNLATDQIQNLFDCVVMDTTIHEWIRRKLAKTLSGRPDLTLEQVQTPIACLANTAIQQWAPREFAKAFDGPLALTAEQVQDLISCFADTTVDEWIYSEFVKALMGSSDLAMKQLVVLKDCLDMTIQQRIPIDHVKALGKYSNLTIGQGEALIACLEDTTIHKWVREELAKALGRCSDLTGEQAQALIACLARTAIQPWVLPGCTKALGGCCLNLAAEQVEALVACLADTTIHEWARGELAKAFGGRPNLTAAQIKILIDCFTDVDIPVWVRGELAKVLGSRSELTAEQVQVFIAYIEDMANHEWIRGGLAKAIAESGCPNLTSAQIQNLAACLKDTTLCENVREALAKALNQRPDLTSEQVQALIDYLADLTIDEKFRCRDFAKALIQRPDLTSEQVQALINYLADSTGDKKFRHRDFAKAFSQHPDLTSAQVQALIDCLADSLFDKGFYMNFPRALIKRSDLTVKQVQLIISYLGATCYPELEIVAKEFSQGFFQRSNLDIEELEQLLTYCLKEEIICEGYPNLIFQILLVYYSNNQIKQRKFNASSELCVFLTSSAAWSELADQQALLICNNATHTIQLRLHAQMIEISLEASFVHTNPFLGLACKKWSGNLHLEAPFFPDFNHTPITSQSNEHQEAGAKISKQLIPNNTEINQSVTISQNSQDLSLNLTGQAATVPASAPIFVLTKKLKHLIQDSLSVQKKYCFLLKRTNANTLTLTFISSNESARVEGRQLYALQKAMETCLKTANLEHECSLHEDTLTVSGDKKVINALTDLLVRQGLDMPLTEVNKRSAFFKAEKSKGNRPSSEEDESIFTCAMQ